MPRKDIELWNLRPSPEFTVKYEQIWGHFQQHRIAIRKRLLVPGCGAFSRCSYREEYPSILWLCMLAGLGERVFLTDNRAIMEEAGLGIKYTELQEHAIVGSDRYLTDFGLKIYRSIKELALSTNAILHMMKNRAAVESLTTVQLKQYLADQCIEDD